MRADDLVVPTATGGTQAGLLVGLRTAGVATAVHGIAVTPPDELRPKIEAAVDGARRGRRTRSVSPDAILLDGDQLGAGYGRPTAAADEATAAARPDRGILVDPIYTAKALAGLIGRVRAG